MTRRSLQSSSALFWGAVVLLAVLHQDFWNWADRRLVLGFLPLGLAYHALFSVAAAVLWAVAVKVVWPTHLEEWADQPDASTASEKEGP